MPAEKGSKSSRTKRYSSTIVARFTASRPRWMPGSSARRRPSRPRRRYRSPAVSCCRRACRAARLAGSTARRRRIRLRRVPRGTRGAEPARRRQRSRRSASRAQPRKSTIRGREGEIAIGRRSSSVDAFHYSWPSAAAQFLALGCHVAATSLRQEA